MTAEEAHTVYGWEDVTPAYKGYSTTISEPNK